MSGGSKEGINPVDIAGAVSMLRFDTIKSIKWDIRPSVGIVAKDVNRLGMDIRSFKDPLRDIVRQVMIPSIRKNFTSEGRPQWQQLAVSTIVARKGAAHPILKRTGTLAARATQLNIWSIGETTATIRSLPQDAFYGVYHQAGASRETGGGVNTNTDAMMKMGVKESNALLKRFLPKAAKELGPKATPRQVKARAIGMSMDAGTWNLPARPFIMYQDEDITKMEFIFGLWMERRAKRVGRFTDHA
jgi:phage gpG-like protein